MNDDEIDTLVDRRLCEHGATWRAVANTRVGVDWDEVAARHRPRAWLVVAAAAAAAAAVVVPIVLVVGGGPSQPLSAAAARTGAPPHPVVISQGHVTFVEPGGSIGVQAGHGVVPYAVVAASNDRMAYAASPTSRLCVTSIDAVADKSVGNHLSLALRHVATIDGGRPPAEDSLLSPMMALSPDGQQLAMVLQPQTLIFPKAGHSPYGCRDGEEVAILNVATKALRTMAVASASERVTSLAWSPDGQQLAYQLTPPCPQQAHLPACLGNPKAGTHLVSLADLPRTADEGRMVLPYIGDPAAQTPYGPIFWWHGHLVTIYRRQMWALDGHGALTDAIESGFPARVLAVSSDPTGDHLLLSAGAVSADTSRGGGANDIVFTTASTYRWDNGVLARFSLPSAYDGTPTTRDALQPSW